MAASRALVLGVQQGISALPPTSAQSFVYEFDPSVGVPVRTDLAGPISLRAAETLAPGHLTLRVAASYFALSTSLDPIVYSLKRPDSQERTFTKFGTDLRAHTGVLDLTLSYGLTRRVEANLNLPIVVVGAQASEIYAGKGTNIGFGRTPGGLNAELENGVLSLLTRPYSQIRGVTFNDGVHAGVGRISLGTKALLYVDSRFRLATSCDIYLPSPNEEQFSGSDSASILPRVIGSARLTDRMRLHADAGYDYDFSVSELRRFVWDVGVSFPLTKATFDLGMGGSKYATPIQWTPTRASANPGVLTAVGDTRTGRNYVEFLAGAKVRLTSTLFLSGAVNIPVTRPGVQPIVGGTLALEAYR